MPTLASTPLRIALDAGDSVSALLTAPADPHAGYVFAHGAGAGMGHRLSLIHISEPTRPY